MNTNNSTNGTAIQPQHYINRELSWIRFNERVLEEAQDRSHPLMERMKFLSIFSSNLDEFFMIRVAGLKEQINASIVETAPDGLTPEQQLKKIGEMLHPLVEQQSQILNLELMPKLRKQGVKFLSYRYLPQAQKEHLHQYFREQVFPILTPLAIDPSHPFPNLRGLAINLFVELKDNERKGAKRIAVVPIPPSIPRFYHYQDEETYNFVLIEQIIEEHIEMLFPKMKILDVSPFRLTRNADLDLSEAEADDLLKLIERELRKRRLGTVIRLEVSDNMSDASVDYLKNALSLRTRDVYRITSLLGLDSLMKLMDVVQEPNLRDEPFTPAANPVVARCENIFEAIRRQDILLHHPYDSFYPVVELVEEAANDPNVLAIKQTLYRTSGRSAIANALKEAALNGKQVTALIELKARFDEETNITWARELERAGVNVVYGMVGLKIHGKMLLVLRQETEGIRHYVHLSTGNYNERTAQVYTDIGLMTCNREIGEDVSELFNLLTGYSRQQHWRKIFVAPINMRQQFMAQVQQCIAQHSPEQPSHMRLMMNSLVDEDMIEALYKASNHGIGIDICVRGICCLVPGVKGLSENIHVRSIVGRFLEHMRVYSFRYGGQTVVYAGSADWMPRNLTRRIEVAFPIEDEHLQAQVEGILDNLFGDNEAARVLQPNGQYVRIRPIDNQKELIQSAQDYFLKHARVRQRAVDTIFSN